MLLSAPCFQGVIGTCGYIAGRSACRLVERDLFVMDLYTCRGACLCRHSCSGVPARPLSLPPFLLTPFVSSISFALVRDERSAQGRVCVHRSVPDQKDSRQEQVRSQGRNSYMLSSSSWLRLSERLVAFFLEWTAGLAGPMCSREVRMARGKAACAQGGDAVARGTAVGVRRIMRFA